MTGNLMTAVDAGSITDPLQKLFWDEQVKHVCTKENGHRWHPMMLKLAILLQSKSQAAYNLLRDTGVLKLPGSSTLRMYKHVDQPGEGFQPHALAELRKMAESLEEDKRFVVLLHDEMTVKANLVFDKRSGQLVGFVNNDNLSFDTRQELATQALVFYVVGVNSPLKFSLGHFGTRSATADDLYPLFWEAIGSVEECGLKVIVSTSDKAPQNQRLYQMHDNGIGGICFKSQNLFDPDRSVYFISDPPHLVKTVRNNLASSGSGKNTKLLWNEGSYILWQHIVDLYHADLQNGLRRTKLTRDHVYLTPHSVMRVKLAAQVLSRQVGLVMQQFGTPEAQETAKFLLLMDRFFDYLNSRNRHEADHTRKPDLLPYTSVDDERLAFLRDDFLCYIENWRMSVVNRPGPFSASDRQKMFLTHQTYRGLVMTVKAIVEVIPYLLQNGVQFVLSNKFCQDPIEEHFGRQRGLGRTAENPTLHQFGYNESLLRQQRSLALMIRPKGNVQQGPRVQAAISRSPLKKKQRTTN